MDATSASAQMLNTLPFELLRKILTGILAESIHAICTSPNVCPWDINAIWTLATTCVLWKETVRDILVKAFAASTGGSSNMEHKSDSECFHLVLSKLMQLRELGIHSREQSSPSMSRHPVILEDRSPLVYSYLLYLRVAALRHHMVESEQLDSAVRSAILKGLGKALNACDDVKASGLARPLISSIEKQIFMVKLGTVIANGQKDLEDCLSKLHMSSSVLYQRDTKTEMHEILQLIETKLCPSCNGIDTSSAEVRQLFEVSRIIQTLVKYRELNIDVDEHGLGRRAGTLVERWGTPEH